MKYVTEKIGAGIQNTEQLPKLVEVKVEVNFVVGRGFLKMEIQMEHCASICWSYMHDELGKLPTYGR